MPLIVIMSLLLMGEQMAWASDSYLLAAMAACGQFSIATLAILLLKPERWLWRALAPTLICLAGMLLWRAVPEFIPSVSGSDFRYDEGAFSPKWISEAGTMACLLTGTIVTIRKGAQRQAIIMLMLAGMVWEIVSLFLYLHGPTGDWGRPIPAQPDRFVATQGNANVAGIVFAMVATLGFGRTLASLRPTSATRNARMASWARIAWPRMIWAAIGFAATLLGFIGIALTQSRTALAGGLLGLTIQIMAALWTSFHARKGQRAVIAILACLIPLIPVALAHLPAGLSAKLPQTMLALDDHTRDTMHYVQLTMQSPWFGQGPGSFIQLNASNLTSQNVAALWNLGAAHSFIVQDALEAGWPHVLLGVLGLALAARLLMAPTARRSRDMQSLPIMLAVMIAVLGGLVDIALDTPAVAALVAWLLGLLLGRAIRTSRSREEAF